MSDLQPLLRPTGTSDAASFSGTYQVPSNERQNVTSDEAIVSMLIQVYIRFTNGMPDLQLTLPCDTVLRSLRQQVIDSRWSVLSLRL
jgi:hypothetical protein